MLRGPTDGRMRRSSHGATGPDLLAHGRHGIMDASPRSATLPPRRPARPVRHRLPSALLGLAVAACAPGEAPDADPSATGAVQAVIVALGDSVPYENDMTSGVLHRVVVRVGPRTDTIPGVLTAQLPVAVGDAVVYGLRSEDERVLGPFAYDVRARRLRVLPTPPDWVPHAAPQLAPDGRHVAYLAQAPSGAGHAAVARLADGHVVLRGPAATMRETDAGVDVVGWTDAQRFEVRIDLSAATGGTQRVRGTLTPPALAVDTLR